jgi:predicted transposase/invertase (TIGR01784 family)
MEELPEKKKDGVPGTYWGIPDFFSLSEDEQVRYERQIKAKVDERCILDSAERKGEARGVANSARAMKSHGLSIDIIKQCTGLSEEEINAL